MDISICASALRPAQWKATYDSLTQNSIEWELIYTGPNEPNFELPKNFIFIKSLVKPSQCYQISFNQAKGELLCWTADDCLYPPNALDNIYKFYKSFNDNKIVVAFRTIEDSRDITEVHRFIGRNPNAPRMAPFGVVNTEMFRKLGGYDRRFICGQSENDVVMRFLEIGGRVEISSVPIYVEHQKAHHASGTKFRSSWFKEDRKVLEDAWMENGQILTKRKYPVESFSEVDITSITQSQKGDW
uniref:Glycosyltransferase n=1 Tax=viral metagenome TaxID=1070528 RepID=A0A6M3IIT4_9ZZZZ